MNKAIFEECQDTTTIYKKDHKKDHPKFNKEADKSKHESITGSICFISRQYPLLAKRASSLSMVPLSILTCFQVIVQHFHSCHICHAKSRTVMIQNINSVVRF